MTNYVKIINAWHALNSYYVKIGSTWKTVNSGYTKVGSTWKQFYNGLGPQPFTFGGIFDNTYTPSTPGYVVVNDNGNNTFYVYWGSTTNTAYWYVQLFDLIGGTYGSYVPPTQYTGNFSFYSSGLEYATVTAVNTAGVAYVYWNSSTNATSYTVNYSLNGVSGYTISTSNLYTAISVTTGTLVTVNSIVATNSYGSYTLSVNQSVTPATTSASASSSYTGLTYHPPFVTPTFSPDPPSITWYSHQQPSGTGQSWVWSTVTASGSTSGSVTYDWQISSSSSGSPVVSSGNTGGTTLNTGTTTTRWARVRARVQGTDGNTYYGTWTGWT